jgi:hypothetical protein
VYVACLALTLGAAGAFFIHETRGTTFWVDEWTWALQRRGGGLDTFLQPHNEHLSLIPIVIYKALFASAGLSDYTPYRLMITIAHLTSVTLLFFYARSRVGVLLAAAAAALMLFFGPGAHNIIWPFQVGWQISLITGIGVFMMLDRHDRLGDTIACVLLGLSLASSGLGLPIALGVAVDVLLGPRRRRGAWIVGAPLALYGLWWIAYQNAEFARHSLFVAGRFAADAAAGTVSSLLGLGGLTIGHPGAALEWGRPLAVLAAVVLLWRLAGIRPVPPRVLALMTILLSFWFLTGLRRAGLSAPDESRYLYVGAFFVLLLAVELVRGVTIRPRAMLLIGAVAVSAIVSNVGILRDADRDQRAQGQLTRAQLGVLELTRPVVKPDFVLERFPGFPFLIVRAQEYFAAAKELGTPAATASQLASYPEDVRQAADVETARADRAGLEPSESETTGNLAPEVNSTSGGTTSRRGACAVFRPSPATASGERSELSLTLPPAGILLRAEGSPATIALRRFADDFPSEPLARIAADRSVTLRVARDLATQPWHVQINPEGGVAACGGG